MVGEGKPRHSLSTRHPEPSRRNLHFTHALSLCAPNTPRCYPHRVADITFSQPARRNLLLPIVIAVVVLVVATALVLQFTPHTTADVTITHTAVYASHIVFKTYSIVVANSSAQDDIYILTNVHIANRLRLPLFLKDFTATLTPSNPDGSPAESITTSAAEKTDLPNLYTTFPALKTLADEELKPPLYRDTQIDPGESAEGILLLHFPVTQGAWDHRKSAALTIDLYHQQPITINIPQAPTKP